jgi:nitrite reductase (NADH) large subunit
MTRHVIIGTGVAGIAAAEAIRTVDHLAEILLITDESRGFYSRPGLAYYLTGELSEKQLYIYSKNDWKRLNIRVVNERALSIHPQEQYIRLQSSGKLNYDRLLLATGASSLPLEVPGANLQGVVYLDHFEDTRRILKLARRGKPAVVVGGGVLAIELVEGLTARGMQVRYFLRGDRYWPNILDEHESQLIENHLVHEGVLIQPRTEIASILGKGGKVTGVRTTGGDEIKCKIVAIGIGVRPRIELAQAAGLKVERGILVDEWMQTSIPNIYAAGDVAEVYNHLTGKRVLNLLWHPAREQGYIAGLNMAGKAVAYHQGQAVNVLRLGGLMTTIIGAVGTGRDDGPVSVTRGSSETWIGLPNTLAVADGGGVNHVRLLIGERTLLGAVVIGEQTVSLPLQELVSNQVDVSPIREQLLKSGASLGQVLMDFWVALS